MKSSRLRRLAVFLAVALGLSACAGAAEQELERRTGGLSPALEGGNVPGDLALSQARQACRHFPAQIEEAQRLSSEAAQADERWKALDAAIRSYRRALSEGDAPSGVVKSQAASAVEGVCQRLR